MICLCQYFLNIVIFLLYIITENYMLQSLFFTVFLFVVHFSPDFCWRRLTLSVLLFRLTASSRPGFPYSPFSSNALSSGAIAEPSPVQTSKSKLLYIQKDPLDGAASFFSVDRVTDQRSAQVMNPVNKWPLQRTHAREKLFCSWRELNPDRPVGSPTFYL